MNRIAHFVALLAVVSTSAMAAMPPWEYRIKLTKHTDGLNIVANTFVGPAVTVGLENHSDKTVFCTASFVSYPHTPSKDETVSAKVPAGKRATLAYPLQKLGTKISTAFVDLRCSATPPVAKS